MDNTFLTCPADCDDELLLGAIPVEQDCTSYDIEQSQVAGIIIVPAGAPDPFASFSTTPTYVAASIDNTVTDNSKSKHLVVIGGIAAPEKQRIEYPKGKSKNGDRTYTLLARHFQLSGGGYETTKQFQCGWTGFTFYYYDRAGLVYGKQGGIVPSFADADFPKGEGEADRNYALLTIQWKADGDPIRKPNPFAG